MSTTAPSSPNPPEQGPLGPLAVSLSGGGYRAASFHLGLLRFLKRMELLRDVTALSTVSGGTIVGMAWVTSVLDGRDFDDFERRFSGFLKKTNVIGTALANLTDSRDQQPPTLPTLIRCAADIYARPELFGQRRLGELLDRKLPWQALIFNSTEFRTGLDFRFRCGDDPQERIGNRNFPVPSEVAKHIRLADVVASSSCFPGGFEPILFPDHFNWSPDYPLDRVRQALPPAFNGGLSLMDGGIYDNQGVDSLVPVFEKGNAATLLISDVAARQHDMYNYPPAGKRGWLTLNGVALLGWVTFVTAVLSIGLQLKATFDALKAGTLGIPMLLSEVVTLGFASLVVGGLVWLRARLRDLQERLKRSVKLDDVWDDLRRLTVPEVGNLVELRVTSVLKLTTNVFMKRIRGLIDRIVYTDAHYENRRMLNAIYSMNEELQPLYDRHPWLEPQASLRDLARWAEHYPTTLWFNNPGDMDRLVQAGEATTCFVLLRFILATRAGELVPGTPVFALFERLRKEWGAFNGTPAAAPPVPEAPPAPAAAGAA